MNDFSFDKIQLGHGVNLGREMEAPLMEKKCLAFVRFKFTNEA